jgi:hypothetical protein
VCRTQRRRVEVVVVKQLALDRSVVKAQLAATLETLNSI